MPSACACFGSPYHDLGAIDDELARIMRDHAGKDVHQRRLAGAVLAEQRMDLAGPNIEIDVVQRAHAWEGLAYAFGRQNRKRAQKRLPRRCERVAPACNFACRIWRDEGMDRPLADVHFMTSGRLAATRHILPPHALASSLRRTILTFSSIYHRRRSAASGKP